MINNTKAQVTATQLSIIGVPIFIGIQYTWWMGVISLVLSFILNSAIGWLSVYYFPDAIINKPYLPYLKMVVVAIILIGLAHLVTN